MPLILELEAQYENAKTDQSFWDEMDDLWTNYVGRPSPLYFAERLTEHWAARRSTSSATS
jgi:tryptophan synthase beta chain